MRQKMQCARTGNELRLLAFHWKLHGTYRCRCWTISNGWFCISNTPYVTCSRTQSGCTTTKRRLEAVVSARLLFLHAIVHAVRGDANLTSERRSHVWTCLKLRNAEAKRHLTHLYTDALELTAHSLPFGQRHIVLIRELVRWNWIGRTGTLPERAVHCSRH